MGNEICASITYLIYIINVCLTQENFPFEFNSCIKGVLVFLILSIRTYTYTYISLKSPTLINCLTNWNPICLM